MPEPKNPPMYNKALSDAIREIYRIYGPNLLAFFRDVEDHPTDYVSRGRELQGHLAENQARKRNRGSRGQPER